MIIPNRPSLLLCRQNISFFSHQSGFLGGRCVLFVNNIELAFNCNPNKQKPSVFFIWTDVQSHLVHSVVHANPAFFHLDTRLTISPCHIPFYGVQSTFIACLDLLGSHCSSPRALAIPHSFMPFIHLVSGPFPPAKESLCTCPVRKGNSKVRILILSRKVLLLCVFWSITQCSFCRPYSVCYESNEYNKLLFKPLSYCHVYEAVTKETVTCLAG